MLAEGGLDPTILVGGQLEGARLRARVSASGEYLVAEADESDGTFLKLSPAIAVVTNIDAEHLDYYGTFEAVKSAFTDFLNKIPFYGACVRQRGRPSSFARSCLA